MLRSLILDNFKAFGRRQVIPLAPITLIFGANSAGKSSILQSLLLLKQTITGAETSETVLLPKGEYVDLGSFREMVFQHDVDRTCEITPILDSTGEQPADRRSVAQYRPYGKVDWSLVRGDIHGFGLAVRYDVTRKNMMIANLPVYWRTTSTPAYLLQPTPARRQETDPLFGGQLKSARLGRVYEDHPVWEELFKTFTQDLPRRTERLDRLVKLMRQEVEDLSALETDYELEQQRKSRRQTQARSPELHRMSSRLQELMLLQARALAEGRDVEAPSLSDFLQRLESEVHKYRNYAISAFLEDIRQESSQRELEIRHFLADSEAYRPPYTRRRRAGILDYLLEDSVDNDTRVPDLMGISIVLARRLRRLLDRISYLGPLREYPERHYIFSGNVARDVGKSGKLLPDLLFNREDLVRQTNERLQAFNTGYELKVQPVNDPDVEDVFHLRLRDTRTNTLVSMLDVGFGISQVLPVIVQSMLARDQVILIEQPEIHLHPKLQAELGELFKACISPPQSNQFIIETHSEHLILRLQRLIKRGELRASDVSVIYVMRDEQGSKCCPLRLDDEGDFVDEWPEGFFEEDYQEIFGR